MAGAGIHCSIKNEKISYNIGEMLTFQFGASNPNENATNDCTMTGTLPDGSMVVWHWIIPPGGSEYGISDYVIRAEDIVKRGEYDIVMASASLEGEDNEGGGFRFYAEASALIMEPAVANKIDGLRDELRISRAAARLKKNS